MLLLVSRWVNLDWLVLLKVLGNKHSETYKIEGLAFICSKWPCSILKGCVIMNIYTLNCYKNFFVPLCDYNLQLFTLTYFPSVFPILYFCFEIPHQICYFCLSQIIIFSGSERIWSLIHRSTDWKAKISIIVKIITWNSIVN